MIGYLYKGLSIHAKEKMFDLAHPGRIKPLALFGTVKCALDGEDAFRGSTRLLKKLGWQAAQKD